jgi:hypothetical protein
MAWTPLPEPRPWPQPRPYTPFQWPQGAFDPLPVPGGDAGPALFEVLGRRRSARQFHPLHQDALGALLWHSQRRQATAPSPLGFDLERRPAPSGGAIHPIHLLVFQPAVGRWARYDGAAHGLHDLGDWATSLSELVDHARTLVADASATLVWFVAEPGKTAAKYEHAESVVWRDAGVLQGVMVTAATGLGLEACLLGFTGDTWAGRLADQGQLVGMGALLVGGRP